MVGWQVSSGEGPAPTESWGGGWGGCRRNRPPSVSGRRGHWLDFRWLLCAVPSPRLEDTSGIKHSLINAGENNDGKALILLHNPGKLPATR